MPKPNVHANVKQTLPLKLSSSSISSNKSDKLRTHNAFPTTPGSAGGSVTQLLPLKLADRKVNNTFLIIVSFSVLRQYLLNSLPYAQANTSTPTTTLSNHTRTGSSPAIVQPHASAGGGGGVGLTSPTSPAGYAPIAASRYEDRSRASRRSDTALIPTRLASMSTVSSSQSLAGTPIAGRPTAPAGFAATMSGALGVVAATTMQPLYQQPPTTTRAAPPAPSHGDHLKSQQEEIYF